MYRDTPITGQKRSLWIAEPNSIIHDTMKSFNMWNGLSVCKKQDDYVESWHVSTTKDNDEMNNFYLNNTEILDQFVEYFKIKARPFIDLSNKDKLIKSPLTKEKILNSEDLKITSPTLEFKKHYFPIKDKVIEMTSRE